jgi:hypothetical protein
VVSGQPRMCKIIYSGLFSVYFSAACDPGLHRFACTFMFSVRALVLLLLATEAKKPNNHAGCTTAEWFNAEPSPSRVAQGAMGYVAESTREHEMS